MKIRSSVAAIAVLTAVALLAGASAQTLAGKGKKPDPRKGIPALKQAKKVFNVPGKQAASAKARCAGKTTPISGGFFAEDFHVSNRYLPAIDSIREKRAWSAETFNNEDPAYPYETFAYCSGVLKTSAKTKSVQVPDIDGVSSFTVNCDKGSRVLSGGFAGTHNNTSPLVFASRRLDDDTWTFSIYNGEGETIPYTLAAYCAKTAKSPKVTTRQASAPFPNPIANPLTVACPKGKQPISGGFESIYGAGISYVTSSYRASRKAWAIEATTLINPTQEATGYAYCVKKKG